MAIIYLFFFFFQAEDGIRDLTVTGVQTCALPIFFSVLLRNEAQRPPCLVCLRKQKNNVPSVRGPRPIGEKQLSFVNDGVKRVQARLAARGLVPTLAEEQYKGILTLFAGRKFSPEPPEQIAFVEPAAVHFDPGERQPLSRKPVELTLQFRARWNDRPHRQALSDGVRGQQKSRFLLRHSALCGLQQTVKHRPHDFGIVRRGITL